MMMLNLLVFMLFLQHQTVSLSWVFFISMAYINSVPVGTSLWCLIDLWFLNCPITGQNYFRQRIIFQKFTLPFTISAPDLHHFFHMINLFLSLGLQQSLCPSHVQSKTLSPNIIINDNFNFHQLMAKYPSFLMAMLLSMGI